MTFFRCRAILIPGLARDNENLDFDEKSLFAISESDAIDAVAPIRIILAIGRLADSFLFIYLFTAVTYVIYYVHNRSFLFLNLNISVEIRSITNTLLRSSWYICYETIPTKNPYFGPGPEKKA
jgi:hypothetical protein